MASPRMDLSLQRGAVERGLFVNSTVKTVIFWVFIFACLVLLWQVFQKGTGKNEQEIRFSDFLDDAQKGLVADVMVNGSDVRGHFKDQKAFHTNVMLSDA